MTATPRAALAAIYATLPPTAHVEPLEAMSDDEVATALHRWQKRTARRREAQAAIRKPGTARRL